MSRSATILNRISEARIASLKTLKSNKKTRWNYAYNAIERDSMSDDKETQTKANKAMTALLNKKLSNDDMLNWAIREQEFRSLNEARKSLVGLDNVKVGDKILVTRNGIKVIETDVNPFP